MWLPGTRGQDSFHLQSRCSRLVYQHNLKHFISWLPYQQNQSIIPSPNFTPTCQKKCRPHVALRSLTKKTVGIPLHGTRETLGGDSGSLTICLTRGSILSIVRAKYTLSLRLRQLRREGRGDPTPYFLSIASLRDWDAGL